MTARRQRERGSASIWVLALAFVLFAGAVVVSLYGSAVTARHRAAAAADLAALAAAERLWSGDPAEPCRIARTVASRNGAVVDECRVGTGYATVTTEVRFRGVLTRLGHASGLARAVPGTADGPVAMSPTVTGDVGAGLMGPDGLTPRARRIRDLVVATFHESDIGGYCPGGCRSGHIPGSDHYTGHAIDIMILPWHDRARVASGWRIASWLVANHEALAVKYVIYRARIWTPGRGWHAYRYPGGATTNPTLMHMDHVHVSVY